MSVMQLIQVQAPKDGKVKIQYRRIRESAKPETPSLTSPDTPKPEFYNALDGLAPFVCDTHGFPESYANGMKITRLKIVPREEGRSVQVWFTKEFEEEGADDWSTKTKQVKVEGAETEEILDEIERQVREYYDGDRQQMQLDLGDGGEEDEEGEDA